MSRIIASSAIKGAHAIVNMAKEKLAQAMETKSADTKVEFPNTGYYLPVIYGLTGIKVEKLSDMPQIIKMAEDLLPEVPAQRLWLPYLGSTLDAGIATLFAEEIYESLKYVIGPNPVDGIWLGAADDVIMRARGIEFVDGSAPGFAAVVGAAPTNEIAVNLARELQQKSLYVFIAGHTDGKSFAEQLVEEGVQLGWDTRLVPFGKDVYAQIYSLGFATRAALSFGGVAPGDYVRVLRYNKIRIFAFVVALGEVDDEKYATAAGAISYGFPTIADTDIPEILPTGVCTYEHVVSNVPHDKIVSKAIEVRGLKIVITEVPVPVSYGPAFEGEKVRKEDVYLEIGGNRGPAFEYCYMMDPSEVEDGKIEVIGPEIDAFEAGSFTPFGLVVQVAGRKMQTDFEPILERQIHHYVNYAEGILHVGQRDIAWIRISKSAKEKGFKLHNFGDIVHAKLHGDFGAIVDKIQVKIFTNEEDVLKWREIARKVYKARDERIGSMTDESVDTFYSCTLCQSFAPNHVCIISPERPGLCGAYNWLDGKASFEINPTGPNQPVPKGFTIDPDKGQWEGINNFVYQTSRQTLDKFNAYSMMEDPMTSCGCFEVICAVLPMTNGIMAVNREHPGMTPCGMKFSTLAGTVGGGLQTPGFIGISKYFITSDKFIKADGGIMRLVWMPRELKELLREPLMERFEKFGHPELYDMIATEENGVAEEEVLEYLTQVGHPALAMDPMF